MGSRILAAVTALIAVFVGMGHFFNRRRMPPRAADVALVFGTGLRWKAEARCRTAAELWHRGSVHYLIASGGVIVPGTELSEAVWFQRMLIAMGVPHACILLEPGATNTHENVAFSLPILREHGFHSVILVMSDFEGIRAHLTARRAWFDDDIAIYDCHAPSAGHWNPWTWWLTAEGWSLSMYTLPRLFRYRLLPYLWKGRARRRR